ncbi:MAG: single-stranded DNA-binding protein [Anaerolineaceae bacterium]|nr:single-stranded DNA-binding protein [Anaerolineaceae bacterium]
MFHTIIIVGNVGRDPEMRYTPSGQAVTSFSVATSRNYKSQGQTVKETIWFRVTCWGRQAEVASNYVKKGQKVLVEGRLVADASGNPRTYTRSDGTIGTSFEITASNLQLLSSRAESEGGYNGGGYGQSTGSMGNTYGGSSDMGSGGIYEDREPSDLGDDDNIPF